MSTAAIDIQGLTKQFDSRVVVDHISLVVPKGSVFGFLGSNGSGKTTMIRMICGLLTPTSGTGRCLGFDIMKDQEIIKTKIAYMPQRFSLYTGLTVYENLKFFASVYLLKNSKQAMEDIIDDMALRPYQHTLTAQLSGGWKQRLALACCLLHKPQLLFLDEPTAGIDPKARKDFWNYLYKIVIRDGTTVLVTTHYMDEAEKCTNLGYIHLGKLLYLGTTKELIPTSKVKTFILEAPSQSLNQLNEMISSRYPNLLVSMVNNELRISSRDAGRLDQFMKEEVRYSFKEVRPSFEEVFIELMQ
ncbi:MAG: ABC transporter ATP-binding protein [Legionellales bacterium]|nr:ABC transporter ATP-binding protein [Legionellales bacterium]